jgi:hypothetical protein
MSEYRDLPVEEQWKIWQEQNPVDKVPDITDEELKEALVRDLSYVSQMSVGEYILYQKHEEVTTKYPTEVVSTLFGEEVQLKNLNQMKVVDEMKRNIWRPTDLEDYANLKPKLILTDDVGLPEKWNAIRTFTSTMKNSSNIGRNLNYLVVDEVTDKYLGVICISSDFLDLTPRDQWIGWEREKKTQGHMINYTGIGSTIVPTQPLGYNYVGGKLLALLCLSDTVQNDWKRMYGDVLTGITTTSLFGKTKQGGLSQYDNLKHWKKMGYTSGTVAYQASKETQYMLRNWMHKHHTYRYFEWYGAVKPTGQPYKRDHRNRSFHWTYQKLKVDKALTHSEHARGIYFSPLYNNTREFLRGEIEESQLDKLFDTSTEYLVDLWKTKYASKRIKSLIKNDRVSDETLYYDDLIYLDWEQTKEKYLNDVGR